MALSRGAKGNYAYVVTEPARVADPAPGTRPAPELERHERIERERAGLPEPEGMDAAAADELAREPIAVLSDVIEREGAEYSALEVQRRNLANADHLAKLHAIWQGETKDTIAGRYERSLREHLPEGYKSAKLSGHASWLWRTLRGAESAGLDADDVLARAINAQSLAGARDVAAVIDSRIRAADRLARAAAARAMGRAGAGPRGRRPAGVRHRPGRGDGPAHGAARGVHRGGAPGLGGSCPWAGAG